MFVLVFFVITVEATCTVTVAQTMMEYYYSSKIKINHFDEKIFFNINVTLKGEVYNKNKHTTKNQIKTITYFGMKIKDKEAEFIVDIYLFTIW